MRFFVAVTFSTLVAAHAIIHTRQSQVRITGFNASGDGCPAGSFSTQLGGQASTTTLDAYVISISAGSSSTSKMCEMNVNLNFPIGCTSLDFYAFYFGFAQIAQSGSVLASYTPSRGTVTRGQQLMPTFSAEDYRSGKRYERSANIGISVSASNAGEQSVRVNIRSYITAPGEKTASSRMTLDSAQFSISGQKSC
jgi:hypothetical protein